MRPRQRESGATGDECDNERETEAKQPQVGVCCDASLGVGAGAGREKAYFMQAPRPYKAFVTVAYAYNVRHFHTRITCTVLPVRSPPFLAVIRQVKVVKKGRAFSLLSGEGLYGQPYFWKDRTREADRLLFGGRRGRGAFAFKGCS